MATPWSRPQFERPTKRPPFPPPEGGRRCSLRAERPRRVRTRRGRFRCPTRGPSDIGASSWRMSALIMLLAHVGPEMALQPRLSLSPCATAIGCTGTRTQKARPTLVERCSGALQTKRSRRPRRSGRKGPTPPRMAAALWTQRTARYSGEASAKPRPRRPPRVSCPRPRPHASDETVALPNLHLVRMAMSAGVVECGGVVRLFHNAFGDRYAVPVVKDDPIRRHRASKVCDR